MTRRDMFVKAGLELMGLPYLYGGKGFPSETYSGRDCSGFVTERLAFVGGPDLRASHNAARIAVDFPEVQQPSPGDVCVYRSDAGLVHHVMVWLGVGELVYGAAGGDETTTTHAEAFRRGARVMVWPDLNFMRGFAGYRRILWLVEGET